MHGIKPKRSPIRPGSHHQIKILQSVTLDERKRIVRLRLFINPDHVKTCPMVANGGPARPAKEVKQKRFQLVISGIELRILSL
jgi:hypothetical protein